MGNIDYVALGLICVDMNRATPRIWYRVVTILGEADSKTRDTTSKSVASIRYTYAGIVESCRDVCNFGTQWVGRTVPLR